MVLSCWCVTNRCPFSSTVLQVEVTFLKSGCKWPSVSNIWPVWTTGINIAGVAGFSTDSAHRWISGGSCLRVWVKTWHIRGFLDRNIAQNLLNEDASAKMEANKVQSWVTTQNRSPEVPHNAQPRLSHLSGLGWQETAPNRLYLLVFCAFWKCVMEQLYSRVHPISSSTTSACSSLSQGRWARWYLDNINLVEEQAGLSKAQSWRWGSLEPRCAYNTFIWWTSL